MVAKLQLPPPLGVPYFPSPSGGGQGGGLLAALLALSLALGTGQIGAHAEDVISGDDNQLLTNPVEPQPVLGTEQSTTGTLIRDSFDSAAMGGQRSFAVYLPPSYGAAVQQRYPVLYLLYGDDASIDSWSSLGLAQKMDTTIQAGLPEMIVVMPDGAGHYNDETDWANRWDGSDRLEDQVLEVIATVDSRYRTIQDRSVRFIGGYSAGGFGALNIALRHPDLFTTVISLSGFAAADDPAADAGVFGSNPTYLRENSPSALASESGIELYFVLTAGQDDAYFRARMAAFATELQGLGISSEFHVVPGAHDPGAWMAGLDFGLAYLTGQLQPGPTAEPR